MQRIARHTMAALALGSALISFALVAEGPATPEPKVAATIEQAAKQNGSCLILAEIRDPQSDEILTVPKIFVAAGEQASVSSSGSERKVEVTVKAGPGCAGGTYTVNVWASGKLAYSKSGSLRPKAQ